MNSLSWLLYLADVCGTLDALFTVCATAGGIATVVGVIGSFVTKVFEADREAASAHAAFQKLLKWFAPIFLVSAMLTAVLPEKETFYAIAASELGEKVLTSKTVSKAQMALDAWLDKQIAPPASRVVEAK